MKKLLFGGSLLQQMPGLNFNICILVFKLHGVLEDLIGMVYTQEELDPLTGKYKKYFDLTTISRNLEKYPEGFTYKVRYKLDLTGKKIPQGKATYTTKTAILDAAVKLGFDNRLEVLKNYAASKLSPERGKTFYRMLLGYYADGSNKVVELEILDSISDHGIGDLLKKTKLSHGCRNSGA